MISIEQAAVNALKTFLQNNLPDVVVSEEWPNPDEPLPEMAVTILRVGAREETKVDPTVIGSEPYFTGDPPVEHPVLRQFKWRVKLVRQPIQLDVWSCYQANRDDLHARLDELLNAGTLVTLSGATTLNSDEFRDGLLLQLGDGHSGFADYQFEGPDIDDTPVSAQRNEFRATRVGAVYAALTITKIQPRFSEIILLATDGAGSSTFTVESDT